MRHVPAGGDTVAAIEVSDFAWAKEDYSATGRTLAIWAFIIELRLRLFLIDQSWTYPGGMTPEKFAPPFLPAPIATPCTFATLPSVVCAACKVHNWKHIGLIRLQRRTISLAGKVLPRGGLQPGHGKIFSLSDPRL
jgi:hypothetical protein